MEAILDAADALIAEAGLASFSTNAVAKAAGISPGSLYQYFDDKEAIIGALADRYLEALAARGLTLDAPALRSLDVPSLVGEVVDPLIAYNLAHPTLRLLLSLDVTSPFAEPTAVLHNTMCAAVQGLLSGRADVDPMRAASAATVSVALFDGVLGRVEAADPSERHALIDELKRALAAYWTELTTTG